MKSWKQPTPEEVEKAIGLLAHGQHYVYFFDRLENPRWIRPLREKGYFKTAPAPQRDDTAGTIRFPVWSASRYLARMAKQDPQNVLRVLLALPDTENVRVHEDLADAALVMPPALSAQIVPKARRWIACPYQMLLPTKLGALLSHLARGGEVEAALDLAGALLAMSKQERPSVTVEGQVYIPPPEPTARFRTWDYGRILQSNVPDLVAAAGQRALALLCALLEAAVRIGHKNDQRDNSFIWRPAVEAHEQNITEDIKSLLVSAVRDGAEQIATANGEHLADTVRTLETHRWEIFQRLALHLLSLFPDAAPGLVADRLANPDFFHNARIRHEYALLLRAQFGRLSSQTRATILALINSEPEHRQRDWLSLIALHLPADWIERYEGLKAAYGEAARPEFPMYTVRSGFVPVTSPVENDKFRSMGVDQIADFLRQWQPPADRWEGPSREGLGQQLTSLVKAEPDRLIPEARLFEGLEPIYVQALFSGVRDLVREKNKIAWGPILDLARWVVGQPRESVGLGHEEGYPEGDRDWGWTRKAIADLLSAGFEAGAGEISFELRDAAWEVLEPLTDDPEPSPEYEAEYGGSNMDPLTLSINTVRGEAMHAVVRYSLWVRRHLEAEPDGSARLARGFSELPEVRQVLDHHLDPRQEPSLALRAVYGQWFPWLCLLDPEWAASSVAGLFPADDALRGLRDAAWEAYVTACPPYDTVFDILEGEYRRSLDMIGTVSREPRLLGDPDERLAEHLMVLYWRGKLGLDEAEGLVDHFFQKAPQRARQHALAFIGRSLQNTEGEVAAQVLERLVALWNKRLTEVRLPTTELSGFGWWFISSKFEEAWAVEQLRQALEVGGKVEADHLVVERLGQIASAMPRAAVECLRLLVEGDKEGWHIQMWRDDARTILASALGSEDPSAREIAQHLLDRLGKRGYWGFFRDLVS